MTEVHFTKGGKGDASRDADSFAPFGVVPGLSEEQFEHWIQALQVQPISAIEWKWKQNWKVGPRVLQDSMWFCFLSGTGRGWVGSPREEFRYGPGDLILLPRGVRHMIAQDPRTESHLFAVHFQAHVYGAISLFSILQMPFRVSGSPEALYPATSSRLCREFAVQSSAWRIVMANEITHVLYEILRQEGARCHSLVSGPNLFELPRFLPVFETIEARLADPALSIADLAERVFLSDVQFRKLFRRVTGINPIRFVQRRRIERSCILLQTTHETIDAIAEDCGFRDTSFFYRTFRRWMHTTPSDYRHRKHM